MSFTKPDIFLFNPTCEYAVANGRISWQPNRLLQKMESDLGAIQLFLAKKEDIVFVDKIPSEKYQENLQRISVSVPSFFLKNSILNPSFLKSPKNRLKPWGWSPAVHKLFEPLKESCSEEFKLSPVFSWKPEQKEIYSKKFALNILKQFIRNTTNKNIFLREQDVPEICVSKEAVEKLLIRWGKIMVKAPWSSSGRGLQPVTKTPVHSKVWEKILGVIQNQDYVIVEPFLNKVLDFSFQFEIIKREVKYLGISNFFTDNKGQYMGNRLNGFQEDISKEVIEFQQTAISEILNPLILLIGKSDLIKNYEGNLSVDALIYNDKNHLRINPCLEMNIRQNMGFLSMQLEKLIVSGKKGLYRMYYQPGSTFKEFSEKMEKEFPLVISSQKKIESGFFPCTEVRNNTLFGSYILV